MSARPTPPAPCLTRPDWHYWPADSHADSRAFWHRQNLRLQAAQPGTSMRHEQQPIAEAA